MKNVPRIILLSLLYAGWTCDGTVSYSNPVWHTQPINISQNNVVKSSSKDQNSKKKRKINKNGNRTLGNTQSFSGMDRPQLIHKRPPSKSRKKNKNRRIRNGSRTLGNTQSFYGTDRPRLSHKRSSSRSRKINKNKGIRNGNGTPSNPQSLIRNGNIWPSEHFSGNAIITRNGNGMPSDPQSLIKNGNIWPSEHFSGNAIITRNGNGMPDDTQSFSGIDHIQPNLETMEKFEKDMHIEELWEKSQQIGQTDQGLPPAYFQEERAQPTETNPDPFSTNPIDTAYLDFPPELIDNLFENFDFSSEWLE
ncbi:MAG: hypothetical protein LBH08_01430 [Puniceicoccales bacterium]|jgi:hypothetical protein|nr:hypothetical protein [Puniceicoccales bacterium]